MQMQKYLLKAYCTSESPLKVALIYQCVQIAAKTQNKTAEWEIGAVLKWLRLGSFQAEKKKKKF